MISLDMIDFYAELNKSDAEFDNGDASLAAVVGECMITQLPLQEDSITLECGHRFNYDAIFNDIYNHKKRFRELETSRPKDHQLRCPYCRNIQNHLLPHYPGKRKVRGVNTLEVLSTKQCIHMQTPSTFWYHYKKFAKGYCCHEVANIADLTAHSEVVLACPDTMVLYNDIDERVYCKTHFKQHITQVFNDNVAVAKKEIAGKKREIAAIVRQEKALAKKKAGLVEKQDIIQKTIVGLQSWHMGKMFLVQTSSNTSAPENVVVSSSITIPTVGAAGAPGSAPGPGTDHVKPVNRCMAITIRNKTQCANKAVKGGIYCTPHKSFVG